MGSERSFQVPSARTASYRKSSAVRIRGLNPPRNKQVQGHTMGHAPFVAGEGTVDLHLPSMEKFGKERDPHIQGNKSWGKYRKGSTSSKIMEIDKALALQT
jgi:hypothetical protein